jgi:TP901 family phage tail tape measure protein
MNAGGIKAGRAFIYIEAMDKTGTVLRKTAGRFRTFGNELMSIGQGFIMKATAALIPAALSTKVFSNFDDAMRRVEARSSGTAGELAEVRKQAAHLGRTTSSTATQVANLQGTLAQKGFNRNQIKEMTPDIRNLSQGAGQGLEEDTVLAADLVSGVIRAYKMEATEAGRVSDVMTAAVNNSNNTLSDLVTSMAYAAPVAKRYGQSLEDTVSVLAVLRDLNIDASTSGTAYRNALLKLSDATGRDDFNKSLQTATGNTIDFVDAGGNLKPLPELLFKIGDAMKGLGTAQQGDILGDLFGLRAVVPASAIADSVNEYNKINKVLKTSQGVAARTAKTMDAGLGGTFRRIWSAVEGVALQVGGSLAPALIGLEAPLATVLDGLTVWIAANPQVIVGVVSFLAGLIALGATLITVGIGLKVVAFLLGSFAAVLGLVKAGFILITSPVILLTGLIVALVATFVNFGNVATDIATKVGSFFTKYLGKSFETLKTTFQGVIAALQIGDLEAAWKIGITGLEVAFLEFLTGMDSDWKSFVTDFVSAWVRGTSEIKANWLAAQQTIATGILDLVEAKSKLDAYVQSDPFLKDMSAYAKSFADSQAGAIVDNLLTYNPLTGLAYTANKSALGFASEGANEITRSQALAAQSEQMGTPVANSFDTARQAMVDEFTNEISQVGTNADQQLDNFRKTVDGLGDRTKERKQQLDELLMMQTFNDFLAKNPNALDGVPETLNQNSEIIDKALQAAPKLDGVSNIPPKLGEVLQRGSVEAVKQFQENRNALAEAQTDIAEQQLDKLDSIDKTLNKISDKEEMYGV